MWFARIVAPIAFLAAATLLVVLVQRALEEDQGGSVAATTADVVVVTTASAETDAAEPSRRFYRIKVGDTLESIAERYDTTVEELLQLNPGVDPLALTPGQRIRVS